MDIEASLAKVARIRCNNGWHDSTASQLASRYPTKRRMPNMIPENTLAVGPALRWLGLAMSVLFVLSVLFVYGGGALWRRLERRALQRSLNKVEWQKIIPAILLSFLLPTTFTAQLAHAGCQTPAPS